MISGHNYLISEPIFKLFVTLFKTHEMQKDDMVIFFLWCFRKVRFQFLKDGVQTVVLLNETSQFNYYYSHFYFTFSFVIFFLYLCLCHLAEFILTISNEKKK